MDHAVLVGRREGVGNLEGRPDGDARFERPVPLDPVLQRPARDVLHGDVVGAVLGAAPIVDGDDVRVGEPGGALRLAPESLDELLVAGVLVA